LESVADFIAYIPISELSNVFKFETIRMRLFNFVVHKICGVCERVGLIDIGSGDQGDMALNSIGIIHGWFQYYTLASSMERNKETNLPSSVNPLSGTPEDDMVTLMQSRFKYGVVPEAPKAFPERLCQPPDLAPGIKFLDFK